MEEEKQIPLFEEIAQQEVGPLSSLIIEQHFTKEKIIALFKELQETTSENVSEMDFYDIASLLHLTLSPTFFSHLCRTSNPSLISQYMKFLSPCQLGMINLIEDTLQKVKDHPNFNQIVLFLAQSLLIHYIPQPQTLRLCSAVQVSARRVYSGVAVLFNNATYLIYPDNSVNPDLQTQLPTYLSQNTEWEMSVSEAQANIYSLSRTIFGSFQASFGKTLPPSVVIELAELISSYDMSILHSLISLEIDKVWLYLPTIFRFTHRERSLLQYCIYEDICNTISTSQLLRGNSSAIRVVIEIFKNTLETLQIPNFTKLQEELSILKLPTKIPNDKDFQPSQDDLECVDLIMKTFMDNLNGFSYSLPTIIKFACQCAYNASILKFNDPKMGQRSVFMLLFFRTILPLLQPASISFTDASSIINVDPKTVQTIQHLCEIIKILQAGLSTFYGDMPKNFIGFKDIFDKYTEKIEKMMKECSICDEYYDVTLPTNYEDLAKAIDSLRIICQPKIKDLTYAVVRPPQFLVSWVRSLLS